MNFGFADLASGKVKSGLSKLDEYPNLHDDLEDLDGPFRLGFPQVQGWGEELLVASLLKRHVDTSEARALVFASCQVCSILRHEPHL